MRVIAIFGPTGVGKTGVSLALAERLRKLGEDPLAVSADALQVYRGLETLTGAPTQEERARLEHRLVGVVPLSQAFSAGDYAQLARSEIDAAMDAGRRPIVVGGTGLYLQAALTDLQLRPPPAADVRERLERELERVGPDALHTRLATADPRAAERIAPGDSSRLVRALELIEMGEQPAPGGEQSALWTAAMRHPTLLCGLVMEREALYERIDARVERMLEAGAAQEVEHAEAAGASRTARAALGYDELLRGDVDAMKRRTRNFAKRQLTWMRRLNDVHVLDLTRREPAEAAAEIEALLT